MFTILPNDSLVVCFSNSNTALHTHECLEIAIILRGSVRHFFPKGERILAAGDVTLLYPGQLHGYADATEDFYLQNVLCDWENLVFPAQDLYRLPGYLKLFATPEREHPPDEIPLTFHIPPENFAIVECISGLMRKELDFFGSGGSRCCQTGYLMALLTQILRNFDDEENVPFHGSPNISQTIKYLHEHYLERFSLPKLLKVAAMSKSSLFDCFSKTTGTSPLQYALHLRIMHAAKLLRSRQSDLLTIAMSCGFSDLSHFSRLFKRITGYTPNRFRTLAMSHEGKNGIDHQNEYLTQTVDAAAQHQP